jgi:hypothetical protein
VVVDGHAIAVDGVLRDVRRGDVLHPVGEPRLDRPALAGLAYSAGVAELLQVADSPGDVGPRLAGDVATVRLAVVLDADGHVSVPAAVLGLVDGRWF